MIDFKKCKPGVFYSEKTDFGAIYFYYEEFNVKLEIDKNVKITTFKDVMRGK